MPLDQCHDFRGGRTVGSASWVTEISKGVLKKDVDIDDVVFDGGVWSFWSSSGCC
jgi:hypothetical protein